MALHMWCFDQFTALQDLSFHRFKKQSDGLLSVLPNGKKMPMLPILGITVAMHAQLLMWCISKQDVRE